MTHGAAMARSCKARGAAALRPRRRRATGIGLDPAGYFAAAARGRGPARRRTRVVADRTKPDARGPPRRGRPTRSTSPGQLDSGGGAMTTRFARRAAGDDRRESTAAAGRGARRGPGRRRAGTPDEPWLPGRRIPAAGGGWRRAGRRPAGGPPSRASTRRRRPRSRSMRSAARTARGDRSAHALLLTDCATPARDASLRRARRSARGAGRDMARGARRRIARPALDRRRDVPAGAMTRRGRGCSRPRLVQL